MDPDFDHVNKRTKIRYVRVSTSTESDVRGITKMFGSDRGDGKYVSAVCDILCILGKLLEHSGKIVGEG